jgi:AraC family transcriptional regulator of adaptative response / DNA-3-methyladenine glycosylase II
VRQPFDAPGVFAFLAARALTGVESADVPSDGGELRYARTLSLPHGPAAVEVLARPLPDAGDWRVRARLELTALADVATAVTRVRRLFDLDADPVAVDSALAVDPVLAPLVARTRGIRVPGAVDPHEMLVRALVGQQISAAAARTHLNRLATAAGTRYESGIDGLDRLFPSPDRIVAAVPDPGLGDPLEPDRPLRLPRRSIRAVVGAARVLATGELSVDVGADPAELTTHLLHLPGIGPWSAAYISMRVLGDPDAWPEGDVALVAGANALGLLDPDAPRGGAHRVLGERARTWAPWRSYAAAHLWQAAPARNSNRQTRKVS